MFTAELIFAVAMSYVGGFTLVYLRSFRHKPFFRRLIFVCTALYNNGCFWIGKGRKCTVSFLENTHSPVTSLAFPSAAVWEGFNKIIVNKGSELAHRIVYDPSFSKHAAKSTETPLQWVGPAVMSHSLSLLQSPRLSPHLASGSVLKLGDA